MDFNTVARTALAVGLILTGSLMIQKAVRELVKENSTAKF